jgi:hypothetical protein
MIKSQNHKQTSIDLSQSGNKIFKYSKLETEKIHKTNLQLKHDANINIELPNITMGYE